MSKEIHIETAGMSETEKTVALLTEICKHIKLRPKKQKAKEIRYNNRENSKKNRIKKKWNH